MGVLGVIGIGVGGHMKLVPGTLRGPPGVESELAKFDNGVAGAGKGVLGAVDVLVADVEVVDVVVQVS